MSQQTLITTCDGLYDGPNQIGATPPGAMSTATNVAFTRAKVAEMRPGFMYPNDATDFARDVRRVWGWDQHVVAMEVVSPATDMTFAVSADKGINWSAKPTLLTQPSALLAGAQAETEPFAGELFTNTTNATAESIYRLASNSAADVTLAGIAAAGSLTLTAVAGAGKTALPTANQVAYRYLFAVRSAGPTSRMIFGEPSGRAPIANSSGATVDVSLVYSIPPGLPSGAVVQIYRTTASGSASIDPGDAPGLVYEGPVPASATTTTLSRTATTVTATTGSAHGFTTGQYVYLETGATSFAAGLKLITGTPLTTTFTYTEAGTAVTRSSLSIVTRPVTATVVDSAPDGFIGAALYTNATQEGALNANSRPPACLSLASFGSCMFYGGVYYPPTATLNLLGTSGVNAIVNGDTVTINGVVYTASNAAEDPVTKTFYITGTTVADIATTARSLVRVINYNATKAAASVLAVYVSADTDPPGKIQIINSSGIATLTVSVSRATAWSPNSITVATANLGINALVWSKPDQPDHIPLAQRLAPVTLGSGSFPILWMRPTRTALFVGKADGVWRITGGAGDFAIQQLDPTLKCAGFSSARESGNYVFAITQQGLAKVSDTGATIVSEKIRKRWSQVVTNSSTWFPGIFADEFGHRVITCTRASAATFNSLVYDWAMDAWAEWSWTRSNGALDSPRDGTALADGTVFVLNNGLMLTANSSDGLFPVSGADTTALRIYADQYLVTGTADAVILDGLTKTLSFTTPLSPVPVYGDCAVVVGVGAMMVVSATANQVVLAHAPAGSGVAVPVNPTVLFYRGVPVSATWSPRFGASPGALTEFQELSIIPDNLRFDLMRAICSANAAEAMSNPSSLGVAIGSDSILLDGQTYGCDAADSSGTNTVRPKTSHPTIRVWPSVHNGFGTSFTFGVQHTNGGRPFAIAGASVNYVTESPEVSR